MNSLGNIHDSCKINFPLWCYIFSKSQQYKMALYCCEIFGDMLLRMPLDSHPVSLFYVTSVTNECTSYLWTAILSPSPWFDGRLVLELPLNPSLTIEQVGLNFCLAWASLRLLFLRKLADDLPWPLSIRQVRMKSNLPSRKVYMSLMTGWLILLSSISLLLWLSAIFSC